jgi:hypothetical protein
LSLFFVFVVFEFSEEIQIFPRVKTKDKKLKKKGTTKRKDLWQTLHALMLHALGQGSLG